MQALLQMVQGMEVSESAEQCALGALDPAYRFLIGNLMQVRGISPAIDVLSLGPRHSAGVAANAA